MNPVIAMSLWWSAFFLRLTEQTLQPFGASKQNSELDLIGSRLRSLHTPAFETMPAPMSARFRDLGALKQEQIPCMQNSSSPLD